MLKFAIALLGALLIMAALAPHGSRTGRIQTIPATATAQLDLFIFYQGPFCFRLRWWCLLMVHRALLVVTRSSITETFIALCIYSRPLCNMLRTWTHKPAATWTRRPTSVIGQVKWIQANIAAGSDNLFTSFQLGHERWLA
jgi:hypothetical protein